MLILIALLIFVLVYCVAKWLLSMVPPIAALVDVLSIALGVLAALLYAGAI